MHPQAKEHQGVAANHRKLERAEDGLSQRFQREHGPANALGALVSKDSALLDKCIGRRYTFVISPPICGFVLVALGDEHRGSAVGLVP